MVSLLCACSANTETDKSELNKRMPNAQMKQIKAVPAELMKVRI